MPNDAFMSELESRYPHIAERIEYFWHEDDFFAFMQGLLTEKEPGRQGFPMAVASELLFLEEVHDILVARQAPPWSFA